MHITSPLEMKYLRKKPQQTKPVCDLSEKDIAKLTKKLKKTNQYGETLLHTLCKQNKASSLTELLQVLTLPDVDINKRDHNGWTALHEAVLAKSLEKTKALLNYQGNIGVDITARSKEGCTPLHDAVYTGNLEMCTLLLDFGGACLIRKMDYKGETPLDLAEKNRTSGEIFRYLKDTLKAQEIINLSPNAKLNMSEHLIDLMDMACNASMEDHQTCELNERLRRQENVKVKEKQHIVIDKDLLLLYKKDQEQFSKLRRILLALAQNPETPRQIHLWSQRLQKCTRVKDFSSKRKVSREVVEETTQDKRRGVTKNLIEIL